MTQGNGEMLSLAPGQQVGGGRYTLVRLLGQGGMGIVWLAKDEQLGEEVALKFLAQQISRNADALEDLRRETLKSRKLTHPNIIRIHDLHQTPGEAPFISMEYVDGQPLSKLKAQQPQRCFDWGFLKPLARQLCEALDYAHGEQVIHRDLKPANLMLDAKGRLKLADFGLAVVVSDSLNSRSQPHNTSGTPAYMSPQQMDGRTPHVTDDLYALGVTLYELLTSKPPFYTGDLLHQTRHAVPDPMEKRLVNLGLTNVIPPEVSALVMACLAKEPAQRPPSAQAMAEQLGLDVDAASASKAAALAERTARQSRRAWTVAAALGLLLAGFVTWKTWWDRSSSDSGPNSRAEEGWVSLFGVGALAYGANDTKLWQHGPQGGLASASKKPAAVLGRESFVNFQLKADIWLDRGASGALVLRGSPSKKRDGSGYMIVLNNGRAKSELRTGSIRGLQEVREKFVEDEKWFTVHTVAIGNRVVVRLNDRNVADCTDTNRAYLAGRVVLLHAPGPLVIFRNVRAKSLPADEKAAWAEVRKEVPDLK